MIPNLDLQHPFSLQGLWWLPCNPSAVSPGTLDFSPSTGTRLELAGALGNRTSIPEPDVQSVILGSTREGGPFTLYDCPGYMGHLSVPGFLSFDYGVTLAFEGALIPDIPLATIQTIGLEFDILNTWAGVTARPTPSGFQEPTDHTSPLCYDISFSAPHISASSPGAHFSMHQTIECESATATARLSSKLILSGSFTIQELWPRWIAPMAEFLSLATSLPVYPSSVSVTLREPDSQDPSILRLFRAQRLPEVSFAPDATRMMLPYAFISAQFPDILKGWFDVRSRHNAAVQMYFASRAPGLASHARLLSIAHALEALHRGLHVDGYLQDDVWHSVHDALMAALPEGLPRCVQDVFRTKLGYLNVHTLRKRLRDLYDQALPAVATLILDKVSFSNALTDTRNYFVHLDETKKRTIARGRALQNLIQEAEWLFELTLLHLLGMPRSRIRSLVAAGGHFEPCRR